MKNMNDILLVTANIMNQGEQIYNIAILKAVVTIRVKKKAHIHIATIIPQQQNLKKKYRVLRILEMITLDLSKKLLAMILKEEIVRILALITMVILILIHQQLLVEALQLLLQNKDIKHILF